MFTKSLRSFTLADSVLLCVCLLFSTLTLLFLSQMLHSTNVDILGDYVLWYEHILSHGRLASLEGSYANYNPPYLYLLSAISLLKLNPVRAVKLVQVPGVLVMACLGYSISRALGSSKTRSLLAGWLLLIAPEVVVNVVMWAQCDTLYSIFILLMIRLMLAGRWSWSMAAFGVAVAFKLQAAFVGPALVALVLTGQLPLVSTLWAPVAYCIMLMPAWLAGRPAMQLLLIYRDQFSTAPTIAANVANPYAMIWHFTGKDLGKMLLVDRLGFVFGAIVAAAIIIGLVKYGSPLTGTRLVAACAAPLLTLPYVLPKMHDRYYFCGNVLLVLLATRHLQLVAAAVAAELSAVLVYLLFLEHRDSMWPHDYVLPCLLTTLALGLFYRFWQNLRTSADTSSTMGMHAAARMQQG